MNRRSPSLGTLIRRNISGRAHTSSGQSNRGPSSHGGGLRKKALSRGPGKHWLTKPAVIYRGVREILNPATPEGCAEKKWRVLQMWLRQEGWCCFREHEFCPGLLKLAAATFEHENKRGAGKHDSRIWDKAGKPMNGAAHGSCNSLVGSRRLKIWKGEESNDENSRDAINSAGVVAGTEK